MQGRWCGAIATLLLLLPPAAAAQPSPPPPAVTIGEVADPDSDDPTFVVTGQRQVRAAEVAAYVDTVLAAPRHDRVARWAERLCLSITGLDDARRDFSGEIAAVGGRLNLDVGQRHCDPSAYVIFTADPAQLLTRLEQDRPAFFGAIPRAAQRPLRDSRAPVRWLSWGELRGAQGQLPMGFSVAPGRGEVERPVPSFRSTPSRLETGTRMDLQAMIVIVDMNRLAGISNRALADYLSMVVLGNVRPDHGIVALPSVLNLLATQAGPAGNAATELSRWDLSYLDALYAGTWNVPASQRIGVIRSAMRRPSD